MRRHCLESHLYKGESMGEKVLSGQKIQMALLSHRDSHLLSAALHTTPIFSLRQMCTVRPVLLTTSAPLTCSRACGQYLIRAIEPKQFSEWVVCSELDSTCTVKTVCRLAQLVLKSSSASAGKCSPEEACHQSSLSCCKPVPSLLPTWQKERGEAGWQWLANSTCQETALDLTE